MEPFGSPFSEACSHLSGSCIVCFIYLICLNFYNRVLRVCHPLSAEVFLFISGIYCKALSSGCNQFLGGTMSVLPQDLTVLLRYVNIPTLGYSYG